MTLLPPQRRRALRCESLERRNLLAAGIGIDHNFISPEDVDGSGDVTPFDALQVINNLNRQARGGAQGEESSNDSGMMLDVDADGNWAPADAWTIVNYLNRNGSSGGVAASLVPLHNRIEALQSAIHNSSVPSWLGLGTAESILSGLHSGVLPELSSGLHSGIEDALHRFDLQIQFNRLSDQLSSVGNQLHSFDSIFSEIGSELSSQYHELRDDLSSSLNQVHQQAESALDALFSHGDSYPSNGSEDAGAQSEGPSLPYDSFGSTLSSIGNELEDLFDDLSSEVHQLDYSGALQSLEYAVSQHLSHLLGSGLNLFDSVIVDHSSDFSQVFSHLESVYDRVVPEVEQAFDHVFDSLNHVGSAASQIASFVYSIHSFAFPGSLQSPVDPE